MALDYSYSVAVMAETLGTHAIAAAIPMAIGVQTDMATPALAHFEAARNCADEFLSTGYQRRLRSACLGVSEARQPAPTWLQHQDDRDARSMRRLRH